MTKTKSWAVSLDCALATSAAMLALGGSSRAGIVKVDSCYSPVRPHDGAVCRLHVPPSSTPLPVRWSG